MLAEIEYLDVYKRQPKLIEEREPERIVFIHVERTRYAHRATRCRFGGKRFVVIEETCGLVLEEVRHLGLDSLGARALLAAIARDEAAMAAGCFIDTEIIHREQASVSYTHLVGDTGHACIRAITNALPCFHAVEHAIGLLPEGRFIQALKTLLDTERREQLASDARVFTAHHITRLERRARTWWHIAQIPQRRGARCV